jgi:HEAT repeat protein
MRPRGLLVLALALRLSLPAAARAEDAVEALRKSLFSPVDPQAAERREQQLKQRVEALKDIGDLRQALALSEWRDVPGVPPAIRKVDQAARTEVGERLKKALGEAAEKGALPSRLAAAHVLGAMGPNIRSLDPNSTRGFAGELAPLLVKLRRDSEPSVRAAAAQALGDIFPDPASAAAALKAILTKDEVEPRRAAAAALGRMIEVVSALQKTGRAQTGVEARGDDVLDAAREVIPAAGTGIKDADAQVRARCLEALRRATVALNEQIPEPIDPGRIPPPGAKLTPFEAKELNQLADFLAQAQARFRPLLIALKEHGSGVAGALKDADAVVAQRAAAALESMAQARGRLHRMAASIPPLAKKDEDPLGPVFRDAVPALAKGLDHENVRVRLACLYALETMETDAAPAADALVQALKDKNPFVRWGAVRALGRMAPQAADRAVVGLAGCLADDSADVRTTALVALRRYGPAAAPAVDSLAGALKSKDMGTQLLVIEALNAIGTKAKAAIPALSGALSAGEPEVRAAAARGLGRFGRDAAEATRALVAALKDANVTVRQAAGEALLAIGPAAK